MLKSLSLTSLVGAWFAMVAVIVALSVVVGASFSTSALLAAGGVAAAVVMLLIRAGTPSPTVAEILRAVDSRDGRS